MSNTRAFEKMEIDGWSDPAIAKGYADGFAQATQVVAERLSDTIKAERGTQVLDLCTGHGVVAAALLKRGASVVGLDFSQAMIALAKSAAPEAEFVHGDAMAMEFEDASFDAVTIGFGVPHFPDPLRGLTEAARVLKPGGRLAFSIWQGKGSEGAFGWLFDAVGRLGDPEVSLPEGPDAHLLADKAVAQALLTETGFTEISSEVLATQLAVSEPEFLFDAFDRGAVRAAALLSGQPAAKRDAIRTDLAARARAEGVGQDSGILVPAPSAIVSAIKK